MFKNIAVTFEEYPEAKRAVQSALELAQRLGASLTVLVIAEPLSAYPSFTVSANPPALQTPRQDRAVFYEEATKHITAQGDGAGLEISTHVLEGDTVHAVLDFVAANGVDLLIVGLHRHALRISNLRSTVYSLTQELSCNVLGVH